MGLFAIEPAAHAEPIGGGVRIDPAPGPVFLTEAQRRTRAELIRDTAAAAGMTNAALLAGIGEVETNFAHCWSEATWACQGPASSTCGGGPVIAGAADGPCSAEQGGLGMFQFDSGTFADTIATYGPDIVTMQGNVNAVIPVLVTRAIQSVDGVDNEQQALDWMNSITIADGDPQYEAWLYFVAWRYNGCMGCTTQINKYRNGTNKLRDEFGPDFWTVSTAPVTCDPIPAAGGRTIDETDSCFVKAGTSTSWYAAESGTNGACLFTYTTDDPAADNQATWQLNVEADGRYTIEVYTDAALAKTHQAKYVVTHAGGTTDVVIDQSAATGFQALGDFELTAGTTYSVYLGDNTGEKYVSDNKIEIMFDAVRVTPAGQVPGDTDGDGEPDDGSTESSGCSTSSGGGLALGLVALALASRRRGRGR
ncbi:MAG TPA: hypothetical protein VFQ53_25050 [Kofleriaceae bacterium]|nr:hypothetical protein [Kofleriaceae bacterium]